MPGVRAVAFFTAGSAGMPYARFICFDGLAALASAPAFVFLGFRFGRQLQHIIEILKRFQIATAIIIVVTVCAWVGWRRWQDNRRPPTEEPEARLAPGDRRGSVDRRRLAQDRLRKRNTL